jgi:gluconolactonase
MIKTAKYVGYLLIATALTATAQSPANSIIAQGATVKKLADGFSFTEGPAVDKKGNVYFTDQPNDRIWIWSTSNSLTLFAEKQGRANGLYFDRKGNLISCSDAENQMWSIDVKSKQHSVIIASFQDKCLNGPNDLWVHPAGGIYFTDPLYARNYWEHRSPEMQQNGQHLYYLSPDRQQIKRMDSTLKQPNGIIGSPDGKRLYVADIGDRKTYVYTILADGSLSERNLFCTMGSDGMTMDEMGNVYLTGRGVTVFNPQGEQIEQIAVDAQWTANVCFGGKDMKTLFITASEYLYSLDMNVKGIR